MKSIILRGTGRFNARPEAGQIVGRNGEIFEPQAVRSSMGHDLFNANGDVNDTSLGFQIAIDTMTYIKKQVTEQMFYEVAPADYMPIAVGEGAFSANILTNLEFSNADDFEKGNIRTGESNARLETADASVASKTQKVVTWAKAIGYTLVEVQQALMANNWDAIAAKERARKRNWDLGLQAISFLGSKSDTAVTGLLNNANVTIDTTTITALLNSLNAADFSTFVATLIAGYRSAVNYTCYPDTFAIPEDDYLGLTTLTPGTVGTFPYPKIKYLLDAFQAVCGPKFQIKPLAYGIPANNTSYGINKHCYALYRKNAESMRMEIPVDYTTTQPNTLNNFQFQNVGYGQYTGLGIFRNLETIYYRF